MGDDPAKPAVAGPIELDLTAMEELADGDSAVLADLIATFVRHTADAIVNARAAIGAGNSVEAARIAHTCIGFTATIGITAMVPTLRQLERAVRHDHRDETIHLLAEWERQFELIREALRASKYRSNLT
jgi:HPt (histidine-containing phosphotransfer) domain-containing protein